MKNTYIYILMLTLITTKSFSQDEGLWAISYGKTLPIGNFASNDTANHSAGYAGTGRMLNIIFRGVGEADSGKIHLGVILMLMTQVNSLMPPAVGDNWVLAGFMGGVYVAFPISKGISIAPKIMIGGLISASPGISRDKAFGFLIGGDFKFNLSKRFSILTNFDYVGTKQSYDDSTQYIGDSQYISTINISLGLCYRVYNL